MSELNPIQAQKFLKGIDYPVSKDKLLETAKHQGADQNVLDTLQGIPSGEYNSPTAVSEALGGR